MASASVRRTVDNGALATLLWGRTGPVVADMLRRGRNVEGEAKRLCPVNFGRLRASITHALIEGRASVAVRIGSNLAYALAVHNGTGVYGPRGTPIRPTRARYLRWEGANGPVYARQVAGSRPRPFLRSALPAARA